MVKVSPIAQAGEWGDECEEGVGVVFAKHRQGFEEFLGRLDRSRVLGGANLGCEEDAVRLNMWVRFVKE
jgi:hypothetical protein